MHIKGERVYAEGEAQSICHSEIFIAASQMAPCSTQSALEKGVESRYARALCYSLFRDYAAIWDAPPCYALNFSFKALASFSTSF